MHKLLIIEDEIAFAEMIKLNLEKSGEFQVRVEYKGYLGIAAAKEFKPNLILLDIIMPNENGLDILRKIKSDAETSPIPVIIMSSLRNDLIKSKIPKSEIVNYMEKPFTLEELEKTVNDALKIRR